MLFLLLACSGKSNIDELVCNTVQPLGEQPLYIEKTTEWGLNGPNLEVTGTRISAVDVDSDGWTDLIVRKNDEAEDLIGEPSQRTTWLLRNTGSGFEDVTLESGFRGEQAPYLRGQVVAFGDVNNDGLLDAFVGCPDDAVTGCSHLMIGKDYGTFERTAPEDLAVLKKPSGATFVDYNRDGRLDLWVVQGGPEQDRLFWGDGAGDFVDATRSAGLLTKSWQSLSDLNGAKAHTNAWSSAACDLNNDGWPELLSASYGRAPNHLWAGSADGYSNYSVESGYAFDSNTNWSDNESARCWCTLHPTDEDCDGVPEPSLISCNQDSDAFRWNHQYDREPFRLGRQFRHYNLC